jgi:hypothetical protein
MADPRYYKVPDGGTFRAPLAADLSGLTSAGGFGPKAVWLNTSGQAVFTEAAGNTSVVGVLVKNLAQYPRLGNIPGQTNLAIPIGGKAGDIVDIMTQGEIVQLGLTAGTNYYAAADGTLSSNPADGPMIGWTVTSDRLVVRCAGDVNVNRGGGLTANGVTVANTVTETSLQSYQLDANEIIGGEIFELELFGIYGNTATPTATINIRLGGTAGTLLAAAIVTTPTAAANDAFRVNARVNFHSATKAVATVRSEFSTHTTDVDVVGLGGSTAEVTVDTTTAKTLNMDLVWGAASASNTLTVLGGSARRIA